MEKLNENKYGLYMGQPIEKYPKDMLIQIIQDMDAKNRQDLEQHQKDLEFFVK